MTIVNIASPALNKRKPKKQNPSIMRVPGKELEEDIAGGHLKVQLIQNFYFRNTRISLKIPPKNDNFVGCNMAAKVLHISVNAPVKSAQGGGII